MLISNGKEPLERYQHRGEQPPAFRQDPTYNLDPVEDIAQALEWLYRAGCSVVRWARRNPTDAVLCVVYLAGFTSLAAMVYAAFVR